MSFTFGQRVRELPRALIWPVWVAACVIVIVGFTGSLVLVIPAAANASAISRPRRLAAPVTKTVGTWLWGAESEDMEGKRAVGVEEPPILTTQPILGHNTPAKPC